MPRTNNTNFSFLNRLSGAKKLSFCIILSIFFFTALLLFKLKILTSVMFGWDFFCLTMIVMSWIIFFTTTADHLHLLAKRQDESLPVIFTIILVSVCFSLSGTILLLMYKDIKFIDKELSSVVSLLGVAFSWMLLHTIFTMRYAHLYYDSKKTKDTKDLKDPKDTKVTEDSNSKTHAGGLNFPDEKEPDYMDFAYFSFVIGMTFQVSDVSVSSRKIRKLVLAHGLISFVFNAIIVALTISIIANLKQ